ncbi:DcaP family trimeric outer membrane transporter [Plebeiibacterium sediminum]|uniref:DcaP family trimeric outer membrane transporter n=1 Tax=Plebeiibacterium sediminum TaxID=2992112 RepID=A0AAE3M2A7_9BACT|nr:DcaP family trimeric outer membrane transporter [Plebeiobacterium sediminum]MCW3785819.1 DcaP family trimeric outer membrane transporter [Plebeiobacterium sediminum]
MKKILFCFIVLLSLNANAQEEQKITVKPYGFVGFDVMMDTHESVTSRQNHVYLYPKEVSGSKKSYDFGAGITRFGVKIKSLDAFGAKTSAQIEGDFMGTSGNGSDFVVRLRHAFINLDWDKSALLIGKTWHPFFIPENFPGMVNFVVGAPIHPLCRAPQIRYTYKAGQDLSLSFIALSQADFANSGGARQVEEADFPEMNLQLKYGAKKDLFVAATFGVKNQKPVATGNTTTSMQANLSLRYKTPALTIKAEGIYGGSMTNMVMIGGVASKANNGVAVAGEYLPIYISSYWTDIHTNGKKVQIGAFGGVTNNLGTKEESVVAETMFTRGSDIEKVIAFAPRVVFISGKMTVGLELLHTIASYGSDFTSKSKPTDTKDYSNNRITLGVRYNF